MPLVIMTFGRTTFSITIASIMCVIGTLSIRNTQHNDMLVSDCSIVMLQIECLILSVVMWNVVVLRVVAPLRVPSLF
jgi:hypothetical protein